MTYEESWDRIHSLRHDFYALIQPLQKNKQIAKQSTLIVWLCPDNFDTHIDFASTLAAGRYDKNGLAMGIFNGNFEKSLAEMLCISYVVYMDRPPLDVLASCDCAEFTGLRMYIENHSLPTCDRCWKAYKVEKNGVCHRCAEALEQQRVDSLFWNRCKSFLRKTWRLTCDYLSALSRKRICFRFLKGVRSCRMLFIPTHHLTYLNNIKNRRLRESLLSLYCAWVRFKYISYPPIYIYSKIIYTKPRT